MARVDWKKVKGHKGLEERAYSKSEVSYRLTQMINGKRIIDNFGIMLETQVIKLVAELRHNRETGSGPQTYKEMLGETIEQEKAEYIAKTEENKRIIAQDNFNKQNSFSYFFDNIYYPYRLTQGRSERARSDVLCIYNKWWRDTVGNMPLTELKYTDIDKVLQNAKKQDISDKRVKDIYGNLQAIYNYALIYFSAHYSIALPVFCGKILKLKKPDNEKVCWLTYEEANILLDTLGQWQSRSGTKDVYAMSVLSLYSGLRFGDIAKLCWRDVEGDIAYAHATKSGQSYGVHLNIKPIQNMLEERKNFFPNRQPEDYVFINQYGEKYKEPPKLFERTIKKLGLNETPRRKGDPYEKITFHSLRHTFASWLAIEGVSIYIIKELMGHSDIKMTQRYAKLSREYTEKHVMQIAHHYKITHNALDIS